MGLNHLDKAKKVKNDEFYTRYEDIEKEMSHWRNKFKDKIVYCPCDSYDSNFFKYFKNNLYALGLKKLICTSLMGMIDANFVFHPDLCMNMFSEEAIKIMEKSDIIVTNPPFSRSREYIDLLIKKKKDFILLGTLNWATTINNIKYILHEQMFPGIESGKFRFVNGEELNNIMWWTSFSDGVYSKPLLELKKSIYQEKYKFYTDRRRIINIDRVKDIPKDWDGLMGVPISILPKINYGQFKIEDCIKPHIGDRVCYQRLVIRKKNKTLV